VLLFAVRDVAIVDTTGETIRRRDRSRKMISFDVWMAFHSDCADSVRI
jgi:hypothetical protein